MTIMADQTTDLPVHKQITVQASPERAFRVFTEEFDSWWPRSHHIGKAPMKRAIVQSAAGGRCYTEQTDGTECDWGTVLVWDPPRRLVIAWQINGQWRGQPRQCFSLTPSSFSFATTASPAVCGFTSLSIARILPSGPM